MVNIKSWWIWNKPRLTSTRKKFSELVQFSIEKERLDASFTWMAIRPIISDLNELQKNTWDKDRVENIKSYLITNFKSEDQND